MRIARTERFKRAYRKLGPDNRERARKAICLLLENPDRPGLRVKRVKGTRSIWEARVSRSCRLTFEIHGDTYILRNIGEHDKVCSESRKPPRFLSLRPSALCLMAMSSCPLCLIPSLSIEDQPGPLEPGHRHCEKTGVECHQSGCDNQSDLGQTDALRQKSLQHFAKARFPFIR